MPHPMRALRRPVAAVPLAFFVMASAGCISSSTIVTIRPDGSGTIEQTVSMRAETAKQLQAMMAGLRGGGVAASDELFTAADAMAAARELGEGVTFVSSERVPDAGRVGRRARYAFGDIRTIHISQRPASPGPAAGAGPRRQASDDVRFDFERQPSGTARLSIRFPQAEAGSAEASTPDTAPPRAPTAEELDGLKKMLDGLRIDIALDVAGTIVDTNSPYVSGSRVTLVEVDFARVIEHPDRLARLREPKNLDEAKALLRDLPGVKISLDRELWVVFR